IYVLVLGTKTFGFQEEITGFFLMQKLQAILFFIQPSALKWLWIPQLFLCLVGFFASLKPGTARPLAMGLLISLPVLVFIYPSALVFERLWIWIIPCLFAFLFQGIKELCQFSRSHWVDQVALVFFFIGVGTFTLKTSFDQSHVAHIQYENKSESLFHDLDQILQPGDFILVSQPLVTELNYWAQLNQRSDHFSRFLIDGDWKYSMYRQNGSAEVLRSLLGKNKIYLIYDNEDQLKKGIEMVLRYLNQDRKNPLSESNLELTPLSVQTKKAFLKEVKFQGVYKSE
ncbi:MAG: hypothetical protein ACK5P5_08325, partial [Pseudobdellovibrionaceae bacterium]